MTSQNISQYQENQKSQSVAKKVLLLLVAVFIVAPLIFFGACFPFTVISDLDFFFRSPFLVFIMIFLVAVGLIASALISLYFIYNVFNRIRKNENLGFVFRLVMKVFVIAFVIGILSLFLIVYLLIEKKDTFFIYFLSFSLLITVILAFISIIKILNSKPDKNK